ncbi:hypothetical protein P3G55_17645 [Leptospira sp. 96542]|nr:hypothetical protein [Leptospira sp. 96542]
MSSKISDVRANLNENIQHAVSIIGKSKDRRKVFEAIYNGKKQTKTVSEISTATNMSQVRVAQEASKLAGNHIVEKVKIGKELAYKKDETYTQHKNTILSLLDNPKRKEKFPTKQRPATTTTNYVIRIPNKRAKVIPITIDDIDSFKDVKKIKKTDPNIKLNIFLEEDIKLALQSILGESQIFNDWGGEKNDLYTNKLIFKGKRRIAAFALKGRATQGVLTPKKMGKNGDQILRLVNSLADFYFVVYHSKIEESISAQLHSFSLGKALIGSTKYFCTIDGDDLNRLYQAYQNHFKKTN